jgi:beta-lactam-binding protein with PASTA domain
MTEVYPDFTGHTKGQVEEFCKDYGCVLTIEEQVDNTKTPGTVISQSRTKGSDVVEGATLTIVVSKLDEKDLVPINQDDSSETNSSSNSSGESSN